jgi:uncharacterized membrane protein YgcG
MQRRTLALMLCALPFGAAAQPPGRGPDPARHEVTLGQDFDDLPPGARQRVTTAFRQGTPNLEDAGVRQRWDAMTADQRGETLRMRERQQTRARQPQGQQRGGPGGGPGAGQGAGQGRGQGGGQGGGGGGSRR